MSSQQTAIRWKVGQPIELEVKTLSERGLGVGVLEGRAVQVRGALPGESVEAVLSRVRSGETEANLGRVKTPHADRVSPRCRHFGLCGGCTLQHLAHPAQVEWKVGIVEDRFRRELGGRAVPVFRRVVMGDPWAYRSKMEFTFGEAQGELTLGLHRRASFQKVVDIQQCEIAPAAVSRLAGAVRDAARRLTLPPYNPTTHRGFWRYAVVRANRSGDLMLLLVTQEGPEEPLEALARTLPAEVPELKSLHWGISTRVSDVACPERTKLLFGSEALEDRLGSVRYLFGTDNFVQPNLHLAQEVYEAISAEAALTGKEAVYDLYSGIGLVSLCLAPRARVVYGVESESQNVAFAQRNAALNGFSNCLFICGKVEDLLERSALFRSGPAPDRIILDPPRAGLHKDVYAPLLAAQAPQILYLSCNPVSLVRDLKILLERDPQYRLESVQWFDFFPHTTHQELMARLCRKRPL